MDAIATKAQAHPEFFYPQGRHPWRDLYTDEHMQKIGRVVCLNDDALERLRFYLCEIAERWVVEAQDVLIELSYRGRARWIDTEIIRPTKQLLNAISFDNHAKLSIWQQPRMENNAPHFLQLGRDLNHLVTWAEEFKRIIQARNGTGMKDYTDFKHALVCDLTNLYARVFRDRRPKRVHHKGKAGIENEFAQFVRLAAEPILGRNDRLDSQIQFAINSYTDMKKTGASRRRRFS